MAAKIVPPPAATPQIYFDLKKTSDASIWKCIDIIVKNNSHVAESINSWNSRILDPTFQPTSETLASLKRLLTKLISHTQNLKILDDSFLKTLQVDPPIFWNTKCVKPCIEASQEIHKVIMPLISKLMQNLRDNKPLSETHSVSTEPSDTESLGGFFEKASHCTAQAQETHQRLLANVEQLPAFNEASFKETIARFTFPTDDLPMLAESTLGELIERLEKGERLTWETGIRDIRTLTNWMVCSDDSLCSDIREDRIFDQAAVQHPAALLDILRASLKAMDPSYQIPSTSSSSQGSSQPSVPPGTPSVWIIRQHRFSVPSTQSRYLDGYLHLNPLKAIYDKLSRRELANREERQEIYRGINWLHGYEGPELKTDTAREDYIKYYQRNPPLLLDALKVILTAHGMNIAFVPPGTPSNWEVTGELGKRTFSVPKIQSIHLTDAYLNQLKAVYEKLMGQTGDTHTKTTPEERQRIYDAVDWLHGYEDPEITTDDARQDYKEYYQYNIPKLSEALKTVLVAHGKIASSSSSSSSMPPSSSPAKPVEERYWDFL
jgi:uncharacterized protein involved in tolerance to divalent cations